MMSGLERVRLSPMLLAFSLVLVGAACGTSDPGPVTREDGGLSSPADAETTSMPSRDAGPDPLSADELARITATLASDDFAGRDEGSTGGLAARAFLIAELERCGIAPLDPAGYEQRIDDSFGANLLAVIPGASPELRARTVLLSAHYDHLGPCGTGVCKGAIDNAAGVALVVGVACTLRDLHPARSVMIALWDAEEPPTFLTARMGSAFYAEHPVAPLEDLDVAVVLDLMGGNLWPGFSGHFVLGAETASALDATLRSVRPPAGLDVFGIGFHVAEEWPGGHQAWSDYDAFRNRNVPALLFSDGQNRNYHTPRDDFSNVEVAKLAREGAYLLDVVTALANATETPTFRTGPSYLADADAVLRLIDAALAPNGLVDRLATLAETRPRLQQDRVALQSARDHIATSGTPSAGDIRAIRVGGQRVLCLAGNTYDEPTCTFY